MRELKDIGQEETDRLSKELNDTDFLAAIAGMNTERINEIHKAIRELQLCEQNNQEALQGIFRWQRSIVNTMYGDKGQEGAYTMSELREKHSEWYGKRKPDNQSAKYFLDWLENPNK